MWGLVQMFEAYDRLVRFLVIICCISVPLGIWKLVEIIIWLFQHISVNWG
jgi:hypothetical protein